MGTHRRRPGAAPKADIARPGGGRPDRTARWGWLALPVALVAVVAFVPALEGGFVDIDDPAAFLTNDHVKGLDPARIGWAFTTRWVGVYQPLAWLTYEFEYVAFGLDPRGFHLTSLALHAATAAALFFLIRALLARAMPPPDGAGRRAAIASALTASAFAAHPLRAEVVAWASCQSYAPCGLLAILAVLAYLRAAEAAGRRPYLAWLAASVGLYAGALGEKAVPMGLPLVLLILDLYPLRRLEGRPGRWRRLLLEKLPFAALGLATAVAAVWARQALGGVASVEKVGIATRLAQACHSAWFYAVKTLAPVGLRAVYPTPPRLDWLEPRFGLAILGVAGFAAAAWLGRRRRPWIAAIGGAYAMLLLPNSGLVTNITVLAADRYSYLATMALAPAVAAGLAVALGRLGGRPRATAALYATSAAILVALAASARTQARTWHDSVAVWSRTVAANPTADPYLQVCLGKALIDVGRVDEARAALALALEVDPNFPVAHNKYGLILVARGRTAEAERHFAEAVRLEPNYMEGRINRGYALAQLGRIDEAAEEFAAAAAMQPEAQAFDAISGFTHGLIEAQANLGAARSQQGRYAEAAAAFERELALDPARPEARKNLGYALIHLGRPDAAAAQYAEALRLRPNDAGAHHNLGHCLSRLGRLDDASSHYQAALRLDPTMAESRRGLDEILQVRAGRDPIRR